MALPIRIAILSLLAAAYTHAGEPREWADRAGRKFTAELIANDAWRATFVLPDRRKAVLPLAQLSPADAAFVAKWRVENPSAPLVDPQRLASWPAEAAAADIEVRVKSEDAKKPAFVWEGAHFAIWSDVRLPVGVVRDLNAVFEGTRAALIALPLGLHSGRDEGKFPALLFFTPEGYGSAGGMTASGGYYDGANGRMLILLPNLGIRATGDTKAFDYQKNIFVVKHEVTHQLLQHWRGALPVWFGEGLAEVIAATPYVRGHYTFTAMDTAITAYVQKWRSPGDLKPLTLVRPSLLMTFDEDAWQSRVAGQSAYELYNSAALFIHFLLRHDGAGDGAPVAAFLDAMRRELLREYAEAAKDPIGMYRGPHISEAAKKAVEQHLRHGRTDARLDAEFAAFLKKRGLRAEFESDVPSGG